MIIFVAHVLFYQLMQVINGAVRKTFDSWAAVDSIQFDSRAGIDG